MAWVAAHPPRTAQGAQTWHPACMSRHVGVMYSYMPRMSIYLPDELAVRVKAEGVNTSQVIQDALRRHLGPDSSPDWAQPPDDAGSLLVERTTRLADLAGEDYRKGYRAALQRLDDIDLETLEDLASFKAGFGNWLANRWQSAAQSFASSVGKGDQDGADDGFLFKLAEDLGSRADPIGYDRFSFHTTVAYERGYGDALRAAYEMVAKGLGPTQACEEVPDGD